MRYTKLKLTKNLYEQLTNDSTPPRKKNVLVFQFTFENDTDPGPKLTAYAMEKKHQKVPGSIPVNLEFLDPTTSIVQSGQQITGDLQIEFTEMEDLRRRSNPSNPNIYDRFVFEPKFNASDKHIFFEVSVEPHEVGLAVIKKSIKPSPPDGAV